MRARVINYKHKINHLRKRRESALRNCRHSAIDATAKNAPTTIIDAIATSRLVLEQGLS